MAEMQEIGSEFWDIPRGVENNLFPEETLWCLSGRWVLDLILDDILKNDPFVSRTAALPSWCCESMIVPFVSRGFSVNFYPVLPEDGGGIRIDTSGVNDCGVLLVMEYFGYREAALSIAFNGIVIRDITHSVFTPLPRDGDYIFGSLRKWAGFWTGGYAWKLKAGLHFALPQETDFHYVKIRRQAMMEKEAYLNGKRQNKDYLKIFSEAEMILEGSPVGLGAEKRDIDAAKQLDVAFLCRKRRENAAILLRKISSKALFSRLGPEDCPLFVPILVPDGRRDALRHFLMQRDIYCPIHWPISSLHRLKEPERRIYDEELSLVCDQRYGPADMERLLTAIQEFFNWEV